MYAPLIRVMKFFENVPYTDKRRFRNCTMYRYRTIEKLYHVQIRGLCDFWLICDYGIDCGRMEVNKK